MFSGDTDYDMAVRKVAKKNPVTRSQQFKSAVEEEVKRLRCCKLHTEQSFLFLVLYLIK